MKLLLFSDLHANNGAAQALCEQAQQVDVVIGAGDFANAGRGLARCISTLSAINKPTFIVPGNNETLDQLRAACASWPAAHVLHGSSVQFGGLVFFGIGGGIPVTPFGAWSFDFTEEQAEHLLAGCPSNCILISHSPPFGVVDHSSQGKHLGSKTVRSLIEQLVPRLVVCGHIHASAGQSAYIGPTPVINAGPLGVVWEISEE